MASASACKCRSREQCLGGPFLRDVVTVATLAEAAAPRRAVCKYFLAPAKCRCTLRTAPGASQKPVLRGMPTNTLLRSGHYYRGPWFSKCRNVAVPFKPCVPLFGGSELTWQRPRNTTRWSGATTTRWSGLGSRDGLTFRVVCGFGVWLSG